jgi:uncharacterized surface protein with fasciclin (FAS1) repeats
MQKRFTFLFLSIFSLLVISCKNDAKTEEAENSDTEVVQKRAQKKVLTAEDIEELNSVMYFIMSTPELKEFARYSVTAELADLLSKEKGPFTVFAPSTTALESMTAVNKKFYSMPENKTKLQEFLKSHIVEGNMNQAALLEAIKKNGKAKLNTVAGITLTASKSGDEIIISDAKGGKAKIQKSDIEGSNGVLYVVDGVLNAN